MGYLGLIKRSETFRARLITTDIATGTPTIAIDRQGVEVLAATAMTAGDTSYDWYHDYTTAADASVGLHEIRYSAVINSITLPGNDEYYLSLNNIDDIADVAGVGARTITINVKDDSANNLEGVVVSAHNSSNDDSPQLAYGTTGATGNVVFFLDDGTYKIRLRRTDYVFSLEEIVVTASATENITGTGQELTTPTDNGVCRLYVFPITLGNASITDLKIYIETANDPKRPQELNSQFITNTNGTFTHDSSTTPDRYYFDAVRGSFVRIRCKDTGFDHSITVPDEDDKDIADLI
jgi:hypothetical protein